jgi:aspartyl/asparaginyl-tRNA synthetase
MARTKIKEVLQREDSGYEVNIKGWVRSFRNNQFIAINDGSCMNNLQVVVELGSADDELLRRISVGASLSVNGTVVESQGKGQRVEVKASAVEVLGECDNEAYPLQLKNRPSLEYLREIAHLRFRTNTFGAVFRVRHALAYAIHKFFNDKGFVYLHTPIITSSDAEGAGEMFRVTTLPIQDMPLTNKELEVISEAYYRAIFESLKSANFNFELTDSLIKKISKEFDFKTIVTATDGQLRQLRKLKLQFKKSLQLCNLFNEAYSLLSDKYFLYKDGKEYFGPCFNEVYSVDAKISITRRSSRTNYPYLVLSFLNFKRFESKLRKDITSKLDFSQDFFAKSTNLTVSGQLEAELGAMAFSEVYTFGPTFRAENSNTPRHLAEFWMIEPEVAFNDITDNMDLAEEFIQYLIRYVLDNNREDLEFLAQRLADEEKQKPQNERSEMGLIEKLEFVLNNKFERITYTEAIDILLDSPAYKKKKFQYDVKWGIDMQSEHERYLVERHFKKPVIVTNYPKEIKAFYMRQNDDGKTVAAMDILAPGIGEIVGGSQREERLDKLTQRMEEMHIPTEEMYWYLDTRRFGTVPHAGFGLGFERMVLFVTGMTNIRDVIPFPRTPKNADF